MPIDDRTANRSYKLPNAGNFLADDVQRLRDALTAIDADIFARYTKTETDQKLADLINGAPGALDTLNELAAAMGNDPNLAATITNALAGKPGFADVWTRTQADARYVQGVTQTENTFTGTGSQTTFTLSQTPPTRESLLVTVDGVVQPVSEYNLSGSALILSEAPASGAKIRVLMLGVAGPVQSSSTLSFTQAGTGAVTRTVDSKLKDVVSVKDFGAVGNGVTDDTAAIQAAVTHVASVGGGTILFPRGAYVLRSTVNIKTTANAGLFPSESSVFFAGEGPTVSTICWLGPDGSGRTGTAFYWGAGIYGGFSGLRFITAAIEGHTSQNIDGFATSTNSFGGCDATSSTAIFHQYNGSFSIERCDFYKFHRAIWMDLGYNRSVRDCSIMFCNVGIGTYGGATINYYVNNRIERCAIGLSFALSSTITCESNVSQANYAGCDVFIGPATHSLHFHRCYFEASPKQVFIQGAGTGATSAAAIPAGHVFNECNSISIKSQGVLGDIYLIRGLCNSVPIEHAGADVATYYAVDCYQHVGSPPVRTVATGYSLGANAKLYEFCPAKASVPGHFGIGTNTPDGGYFSRYATIESAYPALGLRSTAAGGRFYEFGQDILGGNGWWILRDSTATAIRLLVDQTGRFAPGADGTQSLGSAGNRWSQVFASTGTINTSDANEKQDVSSLDEAEKRVAAAIKGLIKKFRLKDAVSVKGDQARIHFGVIAQEVVAAFEQEGLDSMRYGIICYDEWEALTDDQGVEVTPAGHRYGVRYEELLAFMLAAL